MKPNVCAILLASLCIVSGCSNSGTSYAKSHPELSVAHRQLFKSGTIPNGDAIAGLTKEQVKLAMGGGPTIFDKDGTDDVWIYVRKESAMTNISGDVGYNASSSLGTGENMSRGPVFASGSEAEVRTTIFFKGDVAIHARRLRERQ